MMKMEYVFCVDSDGCAMDTMNTLAARGRLERPASGVTTQLSTD